MPKFVIERDLKGAGKLTPDELKSISANSCNVISEMGPKIQWVHSYITDNKIFCVYIAENEEMCTEHAKKGGFPVTAVRAVTSVIDPTNAE